MVLERHPMYSMGVSMVFNGSQPLANDPLNPMVERPPMKWQWILERQPLDSMKWQWISWATIGDEPLYWSLFFLSSYRTQVQSLTCLVSQSVTYSLSFLTSNLSMPYFTESCQAKHMLKTKFFGDYEAMY